MFSLASSSLTSVKNQEQPVNAGFVGHPTHVQARHDDEMRRSREPVPLDEVWGPEGAKKCIKNTRRARAS